MNHSLTMALDIGNVCVRIDHLNCVRRLGLSAIPPHLTAAATEFECGRITETKFFSSLYEMLDRKFTVAEIRAAFDAILIEPVPGMTELVDSLPALGIRAVFFSDISPAHLRRTRELFPAAANVPDGVYSFEAGAQKPAPRMLDAFEARFGRPDLYVDDREELILAAKKRNWHAVRFTDAAALRRELEILRK
ncbi:MAG: hypothetical protein MR051_02925 [Lentisphaeria bacterium]|nr:hypothetical protein [Lentisphaeria bacterium]